MGSNIGGVGLSLEITFGTVLPILHFRKDDGLIPKSRFAHFKDEALELTRFESTVPIDFLGPYAVGLVALAIAIRKKHFAA